MKLIPAIKDIKNDYNEIVFNLYNNDLFQNLVMLGLLSEKINETEGNSNIGYVVINEKGKQINHYLEPTYDGEKYYHSLTKKDEYSDDMLRNWLRKIIKCKIKKVESGIMEIENKELLENSDEFIFDTKGFNIFHNIKTLANIALFMEETEFAEDIKYSILDKNCGKDNLILQVIDSDERIYYDSLTRKKEYAEYILVNFAVMIIGECEKG